MDSTFFPDQNPTAVSIRVGLGASTSAACILSGQLSTAASSTSVFKDNPDQNSPAAPCFLLFLVHPKHFFIAAASASTASTPVQYSTPVSIRGGLGASASAASIPVSYTHLTLPTTPYV